MECKVCSLDKDASLHTMTAEECGTAYPGYPCQKPEEHHAFVADIPDSFEDLFFVLDGWPGWDDWGVAKWPYPQTIRDLAATLKAGADKNDLRALGKQTGDKAANNPARLIFKSVRDERIRNA